MVARNMESKHSALLWKSGERQSNQITGKSMMLSTIVKDETAIAQQYEELSNIITTFIRKCTDLLLKQAASEH